MTKRSRTVDDITRRLASDGWSYGYCAGFDGDGWWKWIADASRGDHHVKVTGAALEEALLELWEAVCGLEEARRPASPMPSNTAR